MTENWKQWEGQVLANAFPLQQYLGGGEDHAVFLTEYGQPSSAAAIKIVLETPDNKESTLARWRMAARLTHPNLLRTFESGRAVAGNTPVVYLVMEYAGESLAQVIPVRPLTSDEARETLEPLLSVLSYIHESGFVHCHLEPGNILAVGECLKLSMSAARRIGEPSPAANDYTTPEGVTAPSADVWSLGITLVETLTQHLPDTRLPGAGVPDTLPAPFLEIARECLRFDPKQRATIADIAARLQPVFPVRRPALRWTYALAAAVGLVLAAVVVAPKIIDRAQPVVATAPVGTLPPKPSPSQPAAAAPARPPSLPVRSEIIRRVLPEVPAPAGRTIQGTVRVAVRVDVDGSGKVTQAKLDSAGPSKYFAQLAIEAARRWKFASANGGDPRRPREWILHFEFSRTGTKVSPVRKGS